MVDRCGVLIRQIDRELSLKATNSLEEYGLTLSQMRFIGYLDMNRDRPVTLKEMERYYDMAQPTVAGIMKKLERRGYVSLIPDPRDRRAKNVILTDAGLDLIESQNDHRARTEDLLLSGFDEEERETFIRLLGRAYDNVKSTEDNPSPNDRFR